MCKKILIFNLFIQLFIYIEAACKHPITEETTSKQTNCKDCHYVSTRTRPLLTTTMCPNTCDESNHFIVDQQTCECICENGFWQEYDICVTDCTRECGENEYLDYSICECNCKKGFYRVDNTCVECTRQCGENEYLDINNCECLCTYGYIFDSNENKCIKEECQLTCDISNNFYLNYDHCACFCIEGYIQINLECVKLETVTPSICDLQCDESEHLVLNEPSCTCVCDITNEYYYDYDDYKCKKCYYRECPLNMDFDFFDCSCRCPYGYIFDSWNNCVEEIYGKK